MILDWKSLPSSRGEEKKIDKLSQKKKENLQKKKNLIINEAASQAGGGGYNKKMLATIGHVGAFSFNYYKNMTSGEGGAVVSNNEEIIERAKHTLAENVAR